MEKNPMVFRLGTLEHAKGYIINMLFEDERFGGRHLPVHLLKHGYPIQWRHLISEAFEELKKENPCPLHVRKKRTGQDSSLHVSLIRPHLHTVRALMNGYRASVGLPRYRPDFKTLIPIR